MRNIVIFLSGTFLLLGCDRLKMNDVAKVQIQLPNVQSSSLAPAGPINGKAVQALINVIKPIPTGFSGSNPINCYVIGYTGPEDSLRQNICTRKDNSKPATFVGGWTGGIPAGGSATLEIPAGTDRVIRVIGFYSPAGDCRDFKTGDIPETLSKPYIVGEVGNLQMKAGETMDIPMPVKYDADAWFDDCKGPDFPDRPDNGGSNPQVPTKITFQKNYFPYNTFPSDSCQTVYVTMLTADGYQTSLATASSVGININGSPAAIYSSMNSCMASGATTSTVNIPAFQSNIPVVFKTPSDTTPSLAFSFSAVSTSVVLSEIPMTFPNKLSSTQSFDIQGPMQILPNLCYPYSAFLTRLDNGLVYPGAPVAVTVAHSAGLEIFYDPNCTSAISSLNFPGMSFAPQFFYVRIDGTNRDPSITMSASGYDAATRFVSLGSGTNTPTYLQVSGDTMGPMAGTCYNRPSRAALFNNYGTSVIAAAPINLYPAPTSNAGTLYNSAVCGSQVMTQAQPLIIPAGATQATFNFTPATTGNLNLALTDGASLNGSYNFLSNGPALVATSPMNLAAANGSCIPVQLQAKNFDGTNVTMTNFYASSGHNAPGGVSVAFSLDNCTSTVAQLSSQVMDYNTSSLSMWVKVVNSTGVPQNFDINISASASPPINGVIHVAVDNTNPCMSGSAAPGDQCSIDTIFAGSYNTYRYMTTRSHCITGSPIACDGSGPDTQTMNWSASVNVVTNANDSTNGNINNSTLIGLGGAEYLAANFCNTLSAQSYGGYNDWFLPSKNELNFLFQNKAAIGNFDVTGNYWSSTENDSASAWQINFGGGTPSYVSKQTSSLIRCIRKF